MIKKTITVNPNLALLKISNLYLIFDVINWVKLLSQFSHFILLEWSTWKTKLNFWYRTKPRSFYIIEGKETNIRNRILVKIFKLHLKPTVCLLKSLFNRLLTAKNISYTLNLKNITAIFKLDNPLETKNYSFVNLNQLHSRTKYLEQNGVIQ